MSKRDKEMAKLIKVKVNIFGFSCRIDSECFKEYVYLNEISIYPIKHLVILTEVDRVNKTKRNQALGTTYASFVQLTSTHSSLWALFTRCG